MSEQTVPQFSVKEQVEELGDHSITEPVEPTWGNEEAVARLIELMENRKGVGDVLAEGVAKACKIIGGGRCYGFALHVRGLEVSGRDPRAQKSVGFTWAISVRGADHLVL